MEQANDIYAKAAAELAQVDAQIAALQKRREEVRQFVELGRKLYPPFSPPQLNPFPFAVAAPQAPAPSVTPFGDAYRARDTTMKARILELARAAITKWGHQTTVQLVHFIEAAGVEITGKDKNVTVSVILSRSPEFVSDRSRGWSLVAEEKTPQDAATSAGPSAA